MPDGTIVYVFGRNGGDNHLENFVSCENPSERSKLMFKKFEDGQRVRALQDVYRISTGDLLCREGHEDNIYIDDIGDVRLQNGWGDWIYLGDSDATGPYDYTPFFEAIPKPRSGKLAKLKRKHAELGEEICKLEEDGDV